CNGFSYRDLAEHVGVKTSSIHYYFPGKDDLLYEAVEAYSARALASVRSIDTAQPAHAQLDAYLSMMESKACGHG
ncbi:TetR/AcrR family transcriptional regulator, partial [Achromobacter dolens]